MSRDIFLNLIDPDPNQPRQHFDQARLEELAASMDANGLAVPILVRPAADRFIIVHGERRYRAALALGWETIRGEVRDVSPDEARWLSLVENVQRADLSPIEEARAYQERLSEGITQGDLGARIGKSQSYVAQKLRLLKLPDEVRAAIDAGDITEGHARQLLRMKYHDDSWAVELEKLFPSDFKPTWVKASDKQRELCERAIADQWAVSRLKFEVDVVLLIDHPELGDSCFADLLKFQRQTASNEYDGAKYQCIKAQMALGRILKHTKKWHDVDGMPWLCYWAMEEANLGDVKALISLDEELTEEGLSLTDLVTIAKVPDTVFDRWMDDFRNSGDFDTLTLVKKAREYTP